MTTAWIFPIAVSPKPASDIGDWAETAYYLKVPPGGGPALRWAASFWDNPALWEGTEEEIEHALEVVREFVSQPDVLLEEGLQDVELQTTLGGTELEYRVKLNDAWSSWRNAGAIASGATGATGAQGEAGDDGREIEVTAAHPLDAGDIPIPSVLDLFWRYVGEAEYTYLERLTAPITTEAGDLLVYVHPRWLVAGNLAQPEGQFRIWNPATEAWEASGAWFETGDLLTAPQGPEGEQGIQGEQGEMGLTGPLGPQGEPGAGYVSTSGQYAFRDWMLIADETIKHAAEAHVALYSSGFQAALMDIYRMVVSAAGVRMPGLEQVVTAWGGLDATYTAATFEDAAVIEEAAQLLYCQLVNHQNMSAFELSQIVEELGEPFDHLGDSGLAANYLASLIPYLYNLRTQGAAELRAELGRARVLAMAQAVKPNWILDCTPTITDWAYVGDWAAEAPDPALWDIIHGAWADGEDGVIDQSGTADVFMTFGETYKIVTLEIIWSQTLSTNPSMILYPFDEYYPLTTGIFEVFRLDNLDLLTDHLQIVLQTGGPPGALATIHRVSLAGFGEPPPWATG